MAATNSIYFGTSGDSQKPPGDKNVYEIGQNAIFKLLVDSVKDYAIFVLSPEGRVMTWNEGAQRIKGYASDEIIGQHFSKFYTEEARTIHHPDHELELAKVNGRYEEEGWRVRKDGSLFWANVIITALRSEKGDLVGFAKVTRDLTERKQAEKLREDNNVLLATANLELQRLAFVVSHELQAPMSTITRYCNLLNVRYKNALGPDAAEFMTKIQYSVKLIARIVDDLWTHSRITLPEQTRVYLRNCISEARAELNGKLDDDGVISDDLFPSIQGSQEQLTRLFKELIANAVRYAGNLVPRVEIRSQAKDAGFVISVKDNGIGIDPVYSAEVFQVFHRLNAGPTPEATGMGLAICKKIVDQHHGRIWFEPNKNSQGTTFFVWLPETQPGFAPAHS